MIARFGRIFRCLTLAPTTSLSMLLCAVAFAGGGLATWAAFTDTKALGGNTFKLAKVTAPEILSAGAAGTTVTVTWAAVSVPRDPAVQYVVKRGETTVCTTTTLTCAENDVPNGSYTYSVTARWGGFSATSTAPVTVNAASDTTDPKVTINQKTGQADPTNALPIRFSVVFDEEVTGFEAGDLVRSGTATGGQVAVTGSGSSYEIEVTDPSSDLSTGTISFSLPADKAADAAGNGNEASTSTDASVTAGKAITVTVNQKSAQADPAKALPLLYTVMFSEPVTGFTASDVTASSGTVAVSGEGASYEVALSGTVAQGAATVSIPAGAARSATLASQTSSASTSTDNSITFDSLAPTTTDSTVSIGNGWKKTAQTVTLTAVDSGSGVAATYYTIDGSNPTTSSNSGTTISLTADGVYTIRYFSVDTLGNAEGVKTAATQIRIDKVAPVSTLVFPVNGASYNAAKWNAGAPCAAGTQHVCATVSDATSGAAANDFTLRRNTTTLYYDPSAPAGFKSAAAVLLGGTSASGEWAYGFAASSFPGDGTYTVTSAATDAAGNAGTSASATFTVDTVAPLASTLVATATTGQAYNFSGTAGTAAGDASSVTVLVCETNAFTCSGLLGSGSYPVNPITGAWTGGTTPNTQNKPHYIRVTQTDTAGNSTSTTWGPYSR